MREFQRADLSWFGSGMRDTEWQAKFDAPIQHSFVGLNGGVDRPASFALPDGTKLLLDATLFEHVDSRRATSVVLPALQPPANAAFKYDRLEGDDEAARGHHGGMAQPERPLVPRVQPRAPRRRLACHGRAHRRRPAQVAVVAPAAGAAPAGPGIEARVPSDLVAGDPALRDALLGGGSKRHLSIGKDKASVSYTTLVPCASGGALEQRVVASLGRASDGQWEVTSVRLEPLDLPRSLSWRRGATQWPVRHHAPRFRAEDRQ